MCMALRNILKGSCAGKSGFRSISDGGGVEIWIPADAETLRGVVVHQHGCGSGSGDGDALPYDLHWQELARKHDCALMAVSYRQEDLRAKHGAILATVPLKAFRRARILCRAYGTRRISSHTLGAGDILAARIGWKYVPTLSETYCWGGSAAVVLTLLVSPLRNCR